MAASIPIRLAEIERQIDGAAKEIEKDAGASAVLKAVFEELHRKTCEARDTLNGADARTIREHLIEVEQAADSAKSAAEAEEKIAGVTRDAVIEVHDALRELKRDISD